MNFYQSAFMNIHQLKRTEMSAKCKLLVFVLLIQILIIILFISLRPIKMLLSMSNARNEVSLMTSDPEELLLDFNWTAIERSYAEEDALANGQWPDTEAKEASQRRMKKKREHLNVLEAYFANVTNRVVAVGSFNRTIVNPFHFRFILNPGSVICGQQEVLLMAFVTTAVEHYDHRKTIRSTWANQSLYTGGGALRRVFVVGISTRRNADRLQKTLELESRLFGDVVQGDFSDDYSNLTYKSLAGLQWAVTHCPQAVYILKIDDDTFVNMFSLLTLLQKRRLSSSYAAGGSSPPSSTPLPDWSIYGRVVCGDAVHRSGKWAIGWGEFRFPNYPCYCSGPGYALTMSLATVLVTEAPFVPFFRLEDIYISGFVPLAIGARVNYVQLIDGFVYGDEFPSLFVGPFRNRFVFGIQVKDRHLFAQTWTQLVDLEKKRKKKKKMGS